MTSPPELVDCAPVTQAPCLSAGFTPVDAQGKPAPVALPAPPDLANAITLTSGQTRVSPFFASAGNGPDASRHTNIVLLVIDISGSMNQAVAGGKTRFEAAKGAIVKYLEAMQEGSDRIALVPFESHNVIAPIRSAVFTTDRADAIAQLNALPQPQPRNNTALYQAVFSGVQSVQEEISSLRRDGHAPDGFEAHMIVMTDGKNEIRPGDDPQLLDGPLGLQQATAQVQASHLDVISIGFGDRDAIDSEVLKHLSTRFFYASDANELLDALHVSRSNQSHQISATWTLPESNRFELAGRDQRWTPALSLTGVGVITGDPMVYIVPALAPPLYSRHALTAELQALIATHPSADSGWSAVLITLLLFVGTVLLILILWFWVPRLVWGDRYSGAAPVRRRWSSDRPATTAASGVQIRYTDKTPPGFSPESAGGPIQRSAAQKTQVQPKDSFSRTRVTHDAR
jgi:Ca-activated chloride channel family protein